MRVVGIVLLLVSAMNPSSAERTLRVLTSTLKLGFKPWDGLVSGAKLKPSPDQERVSLEDISLCMRFNYKLLGTGVGTSQLMHLAAWQDEPGVRTELCFQAFVFIRTVLKCSIFIF